MVGDPAVARVGEHQRLQHQRLPRVASTIVVPDTLRRYLDSAPAITVLCAPRGFGKTSAVASWIRSQDRAHTRYVWIGMPTHPTGPQAFWAEVYRGLTGTTALSGSDPLSLIYQVLDRTLQPTTLVLDNFTYVSDEVVDGELGELIDRFARVRLIAMVRTERAIVALANAHEDSVVLRMPQLGLDGAGVAAIAAEAGFTIDTARGAEIATAVAGWPAVIRILLRDGARDVDGGFVPDWHGIERYCLLVLGDPDIQRLRPVLTMLSCAQEFSGELGQTLIGQDAWDTTFPVIAQAGIIEEWVDQGERRYRIRPRLRDAVQAVLRRHEMPAYRRYHRLLADWYDHRNVSQSALAHSVEAEDWDRAAALVEDYWLELVTGCTSQARQMLRKFPEEVVRASATLLVVRDYILNVDTGRRAREAFRAGHMDVGFAARYENQRLTLSQTLQMRVSGQYEAFRQVMEGGAERSAWADPVLEQMPELLLRWSITLLLTSDVPSAAYTFRQAYQWARERQTLGAKREAGSGLALCLAMLGHLNSAEQWQQRVAGLPEGERPSDLERIANVLVRGLIDSDRLTPDSARDVPPLDYIPALPGLDAIHQHLAATRAIHWGDERERRAAVSALEQTVSSLSHHRHGGRFSGSAARSNIVNLCIANGEFERAHRALLGVDEDQVWAIVAKARLALFEGQHEIVLALTEQIDGLHVADVRHDLHIHLLRACAAARLGRMDQAGNHLQEAASLAEMSGIVRLFALIPRSDLLALDQRFPHVIPTAVIEAVIAAPDVFGEPREPVRLSQREAEVLRQIATGMPLSQVAMRLFVTENTIKSQVRNIYRKLGVHSREDAISRAVSLGLLPGPTAEPAH